MDLKNVEFYPNIPIDSMVELIGRSKIFLHTMLHEDFGLTTCEAIAGRCIPCVIDSGGQKEIVTDNRLRFLTVDDAVKVIKKIESLDKDECKKMRASLSKHIQQFDESNFKKKGQYRRRWRKNKGGG